MPMRATNLMGVFDRQLVHLFASSKQTSLLTATTMVSSSKKSKAVAAVKTKRRSGKPSSDLGKVRRQHANGSEGMMDEDDSSDTRGSDDDDKATDSEQDQLVTKPKPVQGRTARDKLQGLVTEIDRQSQQASGKGPVYKDDSTITSRNTDSQRTPVTSRSGQLVTPGSRPDTVGSRTGQLVTTQGNRPDTVGSTTSSRNLILENTKLRRQLNAFSTVGIHEPVLATAVRKYAKVTLFKKVKFVTNQARLNLHMVQVMEYFHVQEKDRLHWGQTYQHDVCDAINQRRNHVAQNLRKVFNSKWIVRVLALCVCGLLMYTYF